MLTLFTYPRGFGQFSLSPYCVKAAAMLQLSGCEWERQDLSDPRKMPHAKLPVVKTENRLIHDSHNIRLYLEQQGARFDPDLTGRQLALAHALTRMAEEHLYFHLVMDRWVNKAVWPIVRSTYFQTVPRPLRNLVAGKLRRDLIRGLATQGLGRFTTEERFARAELDFQAVRSCLAGSDYLLGTQLSSADLSVWPMLAAIRGCPVPTRLSTRVADDTLLSNYIDRVEETVQLS